MDSTASPGKEDASMGSELTRQEHEEFARRMEAENKRLEDENNRQNKRLDLLEESVRELGALTASVEKLAASVESMVKEQGKQEKRLETLEGRDGEMWRKVAGHVITAVISIVIGFIFAKIGMGG